MDSSQEREFRVEWWSGGVMSLLVAARSAAEATDKARSVPLADDGWSVEGMTNLIVAFPSDSPPTSLPISKPDGTEHAEERNYIVSYDFRTTYAQHIRASDFNAACGQVSREDAGWQLLSDWKDWTARLMRE